MGWLERPSLIVWQKPSGEQKPFDAYVLDYKLPDGSGLDIAEWIRSKESVAPIILISCYNTSVSNLALVRVNTTFGDRCSSKLTVLNA